MSNGAASTKWFMKLLTAAHSFGLEAWEAQERINVDDIEGLLKPRQPCTHHHANPPEGTVIYCAQCQRGE